MTDMYGNGVVRADGFFIPDLLIDLVDGENLSGILDEEQKNIVLDRSQLDRFIVDPLCRR